VSWWSRAIDGGKRVRRRHSTAYAVAELGRDLQANLATVGASVEKTRRGTARVSERIDSLEVRVQAVQQRLQAHLVEVEEEIAVRRARTENDYEPFYAAARPVIEGGTTLLGYDRLRVLWQAVRNVAPLRLPAVEVGAYRGGSAEFIARAFHELVGEDVDLYVLDTFAGHPSSSISDVDSAHHVEGRFDDVELSEIRSRLSQYPRLHIEVGDALETLPRLPPPTYSFVHVDVDLFLPTIETLRIASQRLAAGGVIVVDDFGAPKCPGIAAAVEQFLDESPSFQFWKPDTEQAVLIKVSVEPT
jgi:hypothetical protein